MEKDLETAKDLQYNPRGDFDETEEFFVYTSFYGIKFYSMASKSVQRIIATK